MKITVSAYSWDWELIGFRHIDVPPESLATIEGKNKIMYMFVKEIVAGTPYIDIHSAMGMGHMTKEFLIKSIEHLKKRPVDSSITSKSRREEQLQ